MPTRCNRGLYCRSYCLLNMFRTPLCPSSGAQEYYTVVAACGISCCDFQVAGLPASILQTGHITLSSAPEQQLENHSTKYHRQQPPYNTLELLMMGIVVPETCWVSNKICNKNLYIHYGVHRSPVMNALRSRMNPIHAVACHQTMKTNKPHQMYIQCVRSANWEFRNN